MKLLKFSKVSLAIASFYVLLATIAFVLHFLSVKINPADSGESALPFFMLTLPWMMFVPTSWFNLPAWNWLAYPIAWFCVTFNAFVIYCAISLVTSLIRWIGHRIF